MQKHVKIKGTVCKIEAQPVWLSFTSRRTAAICDVAQQNRGKANGDL